MIDEPLKDILGPLHGKRAQDIYVIISADGSTCVRDPGLGRPYSNPNKKIVEHIAAGIGRGCKVVSLDVAMKSILYHPKNLPKDLPPGFKLPDSPE